MIGVILRKGSEVAEVRVVDNSVYFKIGNSGHATINGLNLSRDGVIKEHPDLLDNALWREIAIDRFKEKIKSFENEEQKIGYIIEDLKKHGYEAYAIQKSGGRVIKLKDGK